MNDIAKAQKDIQRCVRNALNRSITKVAKEQRRLVQEDLNLSHKKIRALTKITRAKDKLESSIKSSTTKLSINNFKRKATRAGVQVRVAKDKNLFFKGAFIAVRRGQKKSDVKNGFVMTRSISGNHGFETSAANVASYKGRKEARRESGLFYLKTKPFSQIVLSKTPRLAQIASEIFSKELSKE
ncbi:hypothetical protein LS71_002785 [Helicobacter jaachi]|uniref:Uncharacterized protein n=1 Tax=Helicobacter jaachi TaxID=1677920 RepID=A0A4U8TCW8_9HELI|nr:hypothetical protein [Helicobacter jaachi]TLD97683.1 hypothetical protein LS71_002785 [Helicobacter jaachi]